MNLVNPVRSITSNGKSTVKKTEFLTGHRRLEKANAAKPKGSRNGNNWADTSETTMSSRLPTGIQKERMVNAMNASYKRSALSQKSEILQENGHRMQRYVNKLQKRIVSAERQKRFRKARELRRMLLHSKAAEILGVDKSKLQLKEKKLQIAGTILKCRGNNAQVLYQELFRQWNRITRQKLLFSARQWRELEAYRDRKVKKFLFHLHPKKSSSWLKRQYGNSFWLSCRDAHSGML